MRKYIRRSLALLLMPALLIVSLSANVLAAPLVINQTVEKQNITSGVVLEQYNRFTTSGWIRTNVLRVDLSNENVKVDSLINPAGIKKTSSVSNLAKSSGALAAVNACFFDMSTGAPFGPVAANGEFAMANAGDNSDYIATLAIDKLNRALYQYWKTEIELITPNETRKSVAAYNNYNGYYNYNMYIVDSKWGSTTPGVSTKYPVWTEMVVEDGVVKEFSENKPGIPIPKNGYVVMATMGNEKFLTDNFKVGDPVSYEIKLNVDSSQMQMALTGGSMLVQGGKVAPYFTHSAAGESRQPRTAAGTTEDGKTLLIVTVDGRQKNDSIGMTQAELAEYMKELGCANAINFDGGSSTVMVARQEGATDLSTVNTPSEGWRNVSASLGVFSIGPQGPVDSLLLSAYEDYAFVNTARAFTVKGVDKYLNPVTVDSKEIEWSVTGVKGTFADNVFTPTTAGQAVITAKIGDSVVGTCPLTVLSAPVKLELNLDTLNTSSGKTTTFAVKGFDKNGFSASIHPSNVKWGVVNKVGTVDSNVFTAGKSGTGYVSASFAGVSVFCPVSISQPGIKKVIEDFNSSEALSIDLSAKTVTAKYDPATNAYKSGPYSGKLTYDFTKGLKENRAAYVNLAGGGKALDSTATKLGMWVYSSTKKPLWIGAIVTDKKGTPHYKYFTKDVNWTGWKYLEVSLDDISGPTKVTKVYAVQTTKKATSGTLYFDDLTMVYSGYPEVAASKSAVTTVPKDEANKDRTVSGADSFSFSVFGQSVAYNKDKDKTQISMLNSLSTKINKEMQASVLVGSYDNLWPSLKVPTLSTTASYKAMDKNGSRLIQLNTAKGGLRATDYNEWFWFKNQLSSFAGNNLFVFLSENPSSFNDAKEGQVLKDMLTDYKKQNPDKNVWVFYKGSTNSSYMDKGVKYVVTAGFDAAGFSDKNKPAAKYVSVKVKGNTITYQFKALN